MASPPPMCTKSSSLLTNTIFCNNGFTLKFSFSCRKHYNYKHSISFFSRITKASSSNLKELELDRSIHKLSTREKALAIPQPIDYDDFLGVKINNNNNNTNFNRFFEKWRRIFFTTNKVRTLILLNLITVIYASQIPVLKEVEEIVDPATFSMVRFVVSAIPFLPASFRARNDTQLSKSGAELGLWLSLSYGFQALGLLTSQAGRASFISMLTIIVVPFLDGMLGVVIPPLTWIGALLSVLGVAMLESSGAPPDVGDLLTFLSAIFFGIHMMRTERISRSTRKENFIPLLGYEMTALRNVSASETAIIYGLEPVWGAGFAWFLLGERWDITGWIGAALIIGGSLFAQMFGSSSSFESEESEE